MTNKRKQYWTYSIIEMFQKQEWKCLYCWCEFDVNDKWRKPTVEHIVPFELVGNMKENVGLCCHLCNVLKWNLSMQQYLDGYVYQMVKPWYDKKSYWIALKVRKKINIFNKIFSKKLWWNNGHYRQKALKLY